MQISRCREDSRYEINMLQIKNSNKIENQKIKLDLERYKELEELKNNLMIQIKQKKLSNKFH